MSGLFGGEGVRPRIGAFKCEAYHNLSFFNVLHARERLAAVQ